VEKVSLSVSLSHLFWVSLVTIIPLLPHAHPLPFSEVPNSLHQAADYHTLAIEIGGLSSDLALAWSQSKEVSFIYV
jgi:hypothetical protein